MTIGPYKDTYIQTKEDKEKYFGVGEWVDEPDQVEFTHCGLKCLVIRMSVNDGPAVFGGYLCGYVALPDEKKPTDEEIIEFEVHGGVTFSDTREILDEHAIGFDCAHAWDLVPSIEKLMESNERIQELKKMNFAGMDTYKNIDYAIRETKDLAEQIKEWSERKGPDQG